MDGLLISKCCADFLNIFDFFLLRDDRAITVGGVFCECENNGKKKVVIGTNKTLNWDLDCEFVSFGAFEISVAGQFAYKQIVTMS